VEVKTFAPPFPQSRAGCTGPHMLTFENAGKPQIRPQSIKYGCHVDCNVGIRPRAEHILGDFLAPQFATKFPDVDATYVARQGGDRGR